MKDAVKDILLHYLDVETISPEDNLLQDFDLSSLDIAELICCLEGEFNITIPDQDLVRIKTVGDIYAYIDALERPQINPH